MIANFWFCPLCSCSFDTFQHIPQLFADCGHSICSSCVEEKASGQFFCPLDHEFVPFSLSCPQPNLSLIHILEDKKSNSKSLCRTHDAPEDWVCLTHRTKVCEYCAKNEEHEHHEIKHVDSFRADINDKKRSFEMFIEECNHIEREMTFLVQDEAKEILKLVRGKFASFGEFMRRKENETCHMIRQMFEEQKFGFSQKLKKMNELKQAAEAKIQDFSKPLEINSKLFKNLKTEFSVYTGRKEHEKLKKFSRDLKMQVESCFENWQKTLNFSFEKFDFSGKENLTHKVSQKKPSPVIQSVFASPAEVQGSSSQILLRNFFANIEKLKIEFEDEGTQEVLSLGNFEKESFFYVKSLNKETISYKLSDNCLSPLYQSQVKKELHMILPQSDEAGNSIIRALKEFLSQMNNLKEMSFCFKAARVVDKNMIAFTNHILPYLDGLSSFSLNLNGVPVTDEAMEALFIKMSNVVHNLGTINLQLDNTKITDQSVQAFANFTLPNLLKVKDFSLTLAGNNITDFGAEQLSRHMNNNFRSIEKFKLTMNNTHVTDHTIIGLVEHSFPFMSCPKGFVLLLNNTLVSDYSFKALMSYLKSRLASLKAFVINLEGTCVSDEKLRGLISYVASSEEVSEYVVGVHSMVCFERVSLSQIFQQLDMTMDTNK